MIDKFLGWHEVAAEKSFLETFKRECGTVPKIYMNGNIKLIFSKGEDFGNDKKRYLHISISKRGAYHHL